MRLMHHGLSRFFRHEDELARVLANGTNVLYYYYYYYYYFYAYE